MDLRYLDLAYLAASVLLVLWFAVEIIAHRYHSAHHCTNARRFGSFQVRYQRCGFLGALLILSNAIFVFNNWSKLGNVGYFYLLRDHCNFVIIFAAYTTTYEVFTVCHRQLYECEKPQLTQAFAYFFISSFVINYFAVLGIDLWITAQDYDTSNENIMRAYVCLIYTCIFGSVLGVMLWVDYDVKRTFIKVFPAVLETDVPTETSTPTTHLLQGERSTPNEAVENSHSRRGSSQITPQEDQMSQRILSKSTEVSISRNHESQSISVDPRNSFSATSGGRQTAAAVATVFSKELPSSPSTSALARSASASALVRSASISHQAQEKLPRDPTHEFAIHVLRRTMKRVLWLARVTQLSAAIGMVFELFYGILLFIKFYLNNQTEAYKNEFTYALTWLQFLVISFMAVYGWIPLRHKGGNGGGSVLAQNNSGGNKTILNSPSMIEAMFIPSSSSQTWGEQQVDFEGGRSFHIVHE